MRVTRRKEAHTKHPGASASIRAEIVPLLDLPAEVLQQVLGMLDPEDLIKLLQTSKVMAAAACQYSAGNFIFKVELQKAVKLEAIRQLLQWAAPSTLQLRLDGSYTHRVGDWSELSSLFNLPSTSLQRQPGQQLQQFPCICSVNIKRFRLPSMVPGDLAAMCPNMHTLHLHDCSVQSRSAGGSSTAISRESNITCSALHTLIVEESGVHTLEQTLADDVRVTSEQEIVQRAEQLKHSLPGVNCLKLLGCSEAGQLVSAFAPQLKELHYEGQCNAASWQSLGLGPQQQLLQKLVLPAALISSAGDMNQLLSLPSLTHLEVQLTASRMEDYSRHPCKWQYLHLSVHIQALDALANLPLHSLKHPLKLGCKEDVDILLFLPRPSAESLTRTEHLAQQLRTCGVQIVGKHVTWAAPITVEEQLSADMAPLLALFAPAMGPQTHVGLARLTVDQPILQVLVAVYGSSLQQLDLMYCSVVNAPWHVALSGLPSLVRLTLHAPKDPAGLVHALATAMAQQPAGRCIEVGCNMLDNSAEELEALVKEVVQQEVEEVHITVKKRGGLSEMTKKGLCFQVARKLVP